MSEKQELIPIVNPNPAVLFAPGGLSELLTRIESDARALVPDIGSAKGRAAIASNAARVARAKVYLDDLGKLFVGELKKQTTAIDAERKAMRDRLDALKDEVRKPLTDWEVAEKERVFGLQQRLFGLGNLAITDGMTAEDIRNRIEQVTAIVIGDDWQEFKGDAERTRTDALEKLNAHLEARIAIEESERIRAERASELAARERKERDERIAREATERAERAAREAMESDRRKQEALRIDAERRAAVAEQQAKDAAKRERDRIEQEARIEREKSEIRARDEANRERIRREIYDDILSEVILEGIAESVVDAIMSGRIRHLRIDF